MVDEEKEIIYCHNCLSGIKQGESYRRANYFGGARALNEVIYIHYPHCPDGADPDAHYRQSVLAGKKVY